MDQSTIPAERDAADTHKPWRGPPSYESWRGMRQRCRDKSRPSYQNYGGRGIKVCERWADSYANFLADMGERPDGTTLDRINNDGDYEPSNCRWATHKQQDRNKRRNKVVSWNGERLCLSEWAERHGIDAGVLRQRLRLRWPMGDALTKPVRPKRRRA